MSLAQFQRIEDDMDFLKDLLNQHGSKLTDSLVKNSGFTADQAQKFVPAASEKAMQAIKGGGFDLDKLLKGGDVSALASKIDVAGLAAHAGIDANKAKAGLTSLLPQLLQLLQGKFDAKSLLASLGGDAGGAIGNAAKMAGKLFGKG